MTQRLNRLILVLAMLSWGVGCASGPTAADADQFTRIGEPRERDTAEMGPYEVAINDLLDHMADTAEVLGQIESRDSSQWAAGLVDQARPTFIRLRREMKESEADSGLSYPELVLNYGGRYISTTIQIEQQLGRIKGLGPEVHEPIKSAMLRLKQELDDAGLPTEP
jgi:hypothetical protein